MASMKIVLYSMDVSPPVRSVLMTARLLGLQLDVRNVDLFKGEHQAPDFARLNPLRQIPVMVHEDLVLRDSHAICCYLVNHFKPGSQLYPASARARALVDQALCFNQASYFPRNKNLMCDFFAKKKKIPDPALVADMVEGYRLLNGLCEKSKWLAGDHMTLGDLCCYATHSSAETLAPLVEDDGQLQALQAWAAAMSALPVCKEVNAPGVQHLIERQKAHAEQTTLP